MRRYLRSLDPRLPRDVYVLELGALVNAFGNGVVLPFLLIYLHNVRGIPFGLAGSAAAVQSAVALASGLERRVLEMRETRIGEHDRPALDHVGIFSRVL